MVRTSKRFGRDAFSMIELIFAIVIIAISVMSLPMMARITAKGMEENLVQEAIFATVAEINMAVTYIWDENSLLDETDPNVTFDDVSKVLNIDGNCTTTGGNRKGHISRRCLDNLTTGVHTATTAFPFVKGLEASRHDYQSIFVAGSTANSASAYKEKYESKLEVNNCYNQCDNQFGKSNNNPNIKEIVVTIRNSKNEDVTLLRAYASNVGEVKYERRSF